MIVKTNGGTVFAEVTGDGPPLLIPGHASTPRYWNRARLFSDEFTVIGLDVRGEAMQTDFPDGPFTLDDIADDCAGALAELGHDTFHFLGLSHTGMLGQALALRHPDRIDRLVLTNTTPGPERDPDSDHELPVPAGEYTEAVKAAETGSAEGIRRLSNLAFSEAAIAQDPSLSDNTVNFVFGPLMALSPEARMAAWGPYWNFNVRDRLAEITARTMLMFSNADRMVQASDGWAMYNSIPRALLIALDGVGHDWYVEAPDLGSRLIRMFLRGDLDPTYV